MFINVNGRISQFFSPEASHMLSNSFFDHIVSKDGLGSESSVFHADQAMDALFLSTLSWCLRYTRSGEYYSEESEES